jgi:hypothetical protein
MQLWASAKSHPTTLTAGAEGEREQPYDVANRSRGAATSVGGRIGSSSQAVWVLVRLDAGGRKADEVHQGDGI